MTAVAAPGTLPIADSPAVVADELMDEIKASIRGQERSQQTRIGPSEIGLPCTRRLAHKLAGTPEPDRGAPWLPTIGTAVHAYLAEHFKKHSIGVGMLDGPRYLVETRVSVGEINGHEMTGSADLFDRLTGTVVDWKIVGPSRIKIYKSKGPGPQYRSQAHLYGRGFQRAGYPVRQVMIAFLPRNGELSASYFWSEQWDETVATTALSRATGLAQLIAAIGVDTVVDMYPPCADEWCPWCHDPTKITPGKTRVASADNPFALDF